MRTTTMLLCGAALLGICILSFAGYVYSGAYDVSAARPDGPLLRWLLVTARDRSIDRRAAMVSAPPLTDPKLVDEGFEHYREMCTGCHLAPGMESSEIRQGLNPQPPVLSEIAATRSPARLFWVIKNGVKMTGMPAWGQSHSDEMIWSMVAFIKRLPTMTPAEYQALDKAHPDEGDPDSTPSNKDHSAGAGK